MAAAGGLSGSVGGRGCDGGERWSVTGLQEEVAYIRTLLFWPKKLLPALMHPRNINVMMHARVCHTVIFCMGNFGGLSTAGNIVEMETKSTISLLETASTWLVTAEPFQAFSALQIGSKTSLEISENVHMQATNLIRITGPIVFRSFTSTHGHEAVQHSVYKWCHFPVSSPPQIES